VSEQRPRAGICVVGSINVDTTFGVPHIPAPGETVLTLRKAVAAGGKGANQAVAAAALGSLVSFIGCVGDDRDGAYALDALSARGVDVRNICTLSDTPTGTAMVLVAPDGENVIVVDQGANGRLEPAQVETQLSALDPAVVSAQLETNLDAVLAAAKNSIEATFLLNPAPMTTEPAAIAEILQYTDVLVPNRTELARLAGTEPPTTLSDLDRCVAALDFPGRVIITLGSAGVAVYESGLARRGALVDPLRVETIDTSGAGDAFCGALAHCLAAGDDLSAAVLRANHVAAWSTTLHGAQITKDHPAALRANA
jgi:ribokinase